MKVEHERKLERTEMKMIRIMCGVSLMEKKRRKGLLDSLRLEPIGTVIRRSGLRWFMWTTCEKVVCYKCIVSV